MYRDRGLLGRMERKLGRFAIRNLMLYIIGAMGVLYAAEFLTGMGLFGMFMFDTAAIMQGEVWRVITFIFLPPPAGIIFIAFALYFYWLVGSALESEWGAFKFNVFYLVGILGTIAGGIVLGFATDMYMGFATNFYLNLSLFFAFAILNPNFQVRLFFILPIKVKWLALVSLALLAYSFIIGDWAQRVAALVSLVNIILFFGKRFIDNFRQARRRRKWRS